MKTHLKRDARANLRRTASARRHARSSLEGEAMALSLIDTALQA
jgi:hypothetical protein